jgi:hypothetical protein
MFRESGVKRGVWLGRFTIDLRCPLILLGAMALVGRQRCDTSQPMKPETPDRAAIDRQLSLFEAGTITRLR